MMTTTTTMEDIIEEYEKKRIEHNEKIDAAQAKAHRAAQAFHRASVDQVNEQVILLCRQQKDLEDKVRQVNIETRRFHKNAAQWQNTFKELHKAFERIDGIEGWASNIETQLEEITLSLENLSQKEEQQK